MNQDTISKYLERKIYKLASEGVGLKYIMDDLERRANKYKIIIETEDLPFTRKFFMINYIFYSKYWIREINKNISFCISIGKYDPISVIKIINFKRKFDFIQKTNPKTRLEINNEICRLQKLMISNGYIIYINKYIKKLDESGFGCGGYVPIDSLPIIPRSIAKKTIAFLEELEKTKEYSW